MRGWGGGLRGGVSAGSGGGRGRGGRCTVDGENGGEDGFDFVEGEDGAGEEGLQEGAVAVVVCIFLVGHVGGG